MRRRRGRAVFSFFELAAGFASDNNFPDYPGVSAPLLTAAIDR
jgi:hypothetical protein